MLNFNLAHCLIFVWDLHFFLLGNLIKEFQDWSSCRGSPWSGKKQSQQCSLLNMKKKRMKVFLTTFLEIPNIIIIIFLYNPIYWNLEFSLKIDILNFYRNWTLRYWMKESCDGQREIDLSLFFLTYFVIMFQYFKKILVDLVRNVVIK